MSENLIPSFDYGSINEDHKKAAEEIAGLVKSFGQNDLAEIIKQRFKVQEPKRFDLSQSKFFEVCQAAGIYCAVQGWIQVGTDIDNVHYPLVGVSEDIRKLDSRVEHIKNNS